ncbi:sensor histidine kinase [Mangrovihabitans endophyticus]|uniref:histidine kinase n=1 Tax=Mangrovihabitans endophyticus TaxID=1751298 RepID=A0A8J3C3L8_9ACTN|nr:sensor histidine kinase [Mangrovihabitans endophyticus]GGL02327.1 histidine kinase [Mangrovihabitans endophyticus]
MTSRSWSIRSKIIALIAVPLAALLALWIFATMLASGPALNLLSARTVLDTVGNPGRVLVSELQKERRLSVEFLSTPDGGEAPTLSAQRDATDRAAADFRRSAGSSDARDVSGDLLRSRIEQVLTELNTLPANRAHIDAHEVDPTGAQGLYNTLMDAAFQMFTATATFGDEGIDRDVRALIVVGRGQEYLSRTDAMLAAAETAGRFTADVRRELLSSVGTAGFLLAEGVGDLPAEQRTAYQELSGGEAFIRLRAMQATLVADSRAGAASPVSQSTWQPVYDRFTEQLRTFQVNAAAALADEAQPVAVGVLIRLGAAGLLGLLAVVVSVVVSIRVGRSLAGRLVRLRGEALEMAGERLPTVVRRLQRGETVDVDVETPPLEYGGDEIGQLGHAFTEVQRTAVRSAVEEANVRRGINEVFLNIARRSQTLLHRQLALLDKMERRETEPDELEDLYRVDHLATRMRRHAEDLVILAGAAPGRGWRHPVGLIDVVRGAISEVEDYKRIDIRGVQPSAVVGRAVGDVIHLLAELLENATSFSPPQTRVDVAGQVLPNGYAIEIDDRGLGMSQEAIDEANRKLLEPPEFDPSDSARLGLFVVAQLAHRHGVRVSLRPSAFSGVTAIVMIPGELITAAPGLAALPAGPSATGPDQPLVGNGTDDPQRRSLAALQWQGAEKLQSLPVQGRPATIEGTATPAEPAAPAGSPASPGRAIPRPRTPVTGPAPSSVAAGLSAEGLVQRRRTPRHRPGGTPVEAAAETPQPAAEPADGAREGAAPESPADPPATPEGLPRRVRQANLVPQLRERPVTDNQRDVMSLRSPEKVRELMSALQQGTARGRLAAAGIDPDHTAPAAATAEEAPGADAGFSEAATVSLPVVRDDGAGETGGDDSDRHGGAGRGDKTDGPGRHDGSSHAPHDQAG